MGERISLLVMLSGIALALYGLGFSAEWAAALMLMGFAGTDFLLLKRRKKKPPPRETTSSAEAETTNRVEEDAMTDGGGEDDESEPAWKRFSKLRVPVRHTEQGAPTQGTRGQDPINRPTFKADAAPPAMERAGRIRPETPMQVKEVQSETHDTPQQNGDPLEKYRLDQFNDPVRPAPIAESIAVVNFTPVRTPTGPAFVPPVAQPGVVRAPRASDTRRPPRPILKPEDFTRNAGKRGFLYLARNPEHWDGLFKVGQTEKHPRIRVGQLNTLHAKHKDIGAFELLDVVEVADAYGAEQVLFLVLSDLRPVAGREFFIANRAYLSKVMRAVANLISGRAEELNNLYRDLNPSDFPAWPGKTPWYRRPHSSGGIGWVYLARCQYHLADTYIFGATKETPEAEVAKLNDGQRSDTPQIGFYTVVFALPVWDTKASRTVGWRALGPWKLNGSRSYVRGPLAQIAETLTAALRAEAGCQVH